MVRDNMEDTTFNEMTEMPYGEIFGQKLSVICTVTRLSRVELTGKI